MKRKSRQLALLQRTPPAEKGKATELPNMVLEPRTEDTGYLIIPRVLGCAGVARDSDRVSAGHFLPAPEKTRAVRSG